MAQRYRSNCAMLLASALLSPVFLVACGPQKSRDAAVRAGSGSASALSPVLSVDFESGLPAGWTAATSSGTCTWHVVNNPQNLSITSALNPTSVTVPDSGAHLPAKGGTHVVWFGEDTTGTYIGTPYTAGTKNGGTSSAIQTGTLTSPSFSLAAGAKADVEFDSWWEIEGVAGQDYDVMMVQASTDGTTWSEVGRLNPTFPTNTNSDVGYTAGGSGAVPVWRHYAFDISSYAGQTLQLRFSFDTRDQMYNGFRGWTLDNVSVASGPSLPAPTVTSVNPAVGTHNDLVTITGTNFVQGATFWLGATQIPAASILQFGTEAMLFQVPSGLTNGTKYDVKVVNPDAQSETLAQGFTYSSTASPTVSGVSPATGTVGVAQTVTLTGSNFVSGATVQVGSYAATGVVFGSSTSLTATFPAMPAGTYNVVVTNPSGQSGSKIAAYAIPPVVDSSTITVTAPNGGESWQVGTTHAITWTETGVTTARIDLYKGGSFAQTIATGVSGAAGTYSWAIPGGLTPGTDYTVKVSNQLGVNGDYGDATFSVTAAASGTSIAVTSGTTTYPAQAAPVVLDDGLTVTSPSSIDDAKVSISSGFVAGQDVLGFTDQNGITGSFNATTGVLTLTGTATAATYQAALRSVTYSNSAANPGTGARQVTFSLGSGLYYSGTGHFYEFVSAPGITWASANTAASARSYFGLQGYLVTVTSAGENAFIQGKLTGQGWMGASTPVFSVPRTWSWVTGPEAGTAFFTQTTQYPSAGGGTAIGGAYSNWATGEPNNWTGVENYAHFYLDGTWNDFAGDNASIAGYGVEYGGMAGDPVVVLSGTRALSVTPPYTLSFQTDGTAGATLTGTTTQYVGAGGDGTAVTAHAPSGSKFVDWTGTGGFTTSTTNPLTVTGVSASMVITANFGPSAVCGNGAVEAGETCDDGNTAGGDGCSAACQVEAGYSCPPAGGACTPEYTLTFQTDGTPGASLGGSTSQTVLSGGNATAVTAAAPAGTNFSGWTGTGGFVPTSANPLTVSGVTSSQVITASFSGLGSLVAGSGGTQSATVGTSFGAQLCVQALDTRGVPLAGIVVHFGVPASGPSASLTADVTSDGSGMACTGLTANTAAGAYGVSASAADGTVVLAAAAALANLAGAPASWALLEAGSAEQATTVGQAFPSSLAVILLDGFGNPVPCVAVDFTPHADGGTGFLAVLSAGTATTDSSGVAQVTATANHVTGWESLDVRYAETTAAEAFRLTGTPDAPASLAVDPASSPQSAQVGGTAFGSALGVTVTDQWSNAVPGVTVGFAAPPSGARALLSSGTAATDASGHAQVTATSGDIAGDYAVTASVGSLTAPIPLSNTVGPPGSIVVVSGNGQRTSVDGTFGAPLVTQVLDAFSNPVPGVLVAFQVASSPATATLSAAGLVTGADGMAEVTATPDTIAGALQVVASADGVSGPATFDLVLDPGLPASVTAAPTSATQTAQVATAFQNSLLVTVKDSHGNVVPGVSVTFAAPSSGAGADLSSEGTTTGEDGTAFVTAIADTVAGDYTVTATVDGVLLPATFALTNQPDAADVLATTGGTPQSAVVDAGFALPLSVSVLDRYGNPVPGVTVSFAAPGSGATAVLGATSADTAADGSASVQATAGTVSGDYYVTASAAGVAAPVQFALLNLPGAPVTLVVNPGSTGQSTRVGDSYAVSLGATLEDVHGNPVPGRSVSFACPLVEPACTLDAPSATTDASGRVAVHATAGSLPGLVAVTASASGVPDALFHLTNLVGLPGSVESTGGASQEAGVLTAYAAPLGILVKDAFGNPVPGVLVTFAVVSSGAQSAELSSATATTDGAGLASVSATANAAKGELKVQASAPGVAAPAVFSLTNVSIPTQLEVHIDLPVFATVVQESGTTHLRVEVGPDAGSTKATGTVSFTASRTIRLLPGQAGVAQAGGTIVAPLVSGAVDVEVAVVGWQSRTLRIDYLPDAAAAETWDPVSRTVSLTADVQHQRHGGGCSSAGDTASLALLPFFLLGLRLRSRRRMMALAVLSLALLPASAHAQWTLGARFGYSLAGGRAVQGSPMSDGIKSQFPVQLEGGYRLFPELTLGAYASYGPAQVGSSCAGTSCSASVVRLGLQAAWRFDRVLAVHPWAGAGLGYEWARYHARDGSDALDVTLHGLEFLDLQGGADYPVADKVSIGPFVSLAFGRYDKLDVRSPLGDSNGGAPSAAVHTWLSFGVRGTYDL
jgi:cysteine-rich repeat protein